MKIIAEIGQNHNGDMGLAREMIYSAGENGADAVKFQLYEARKLFPKDNNPWFEYNCRAELSRDDTFRLAEECAAAGVEFLASAFDTERVGWLEEIGVRRYKLASRSIRDKGLIDCLCRTRKPLLVSLGMWHEKDFPAFDTTAKVDFLYCVSKYPAPLTEVNLNSVDFSLYEGLSDHTSGMSTAISALARGAKIIEKHFTLDKNMHGPDHACSMTPAGLKALNNFRQDLKELL